MLSDPNSGHRALPPVPTIPSGPTLPRLITWAQQVVNWLLKLRDFIAGVPGGWKDVTPNATGTASDSGDPNQGWMAADATIKQGIVTTKGDVLTHSATVPARLAVGANTRILLADSSEATGLRWADQSELGAAGGGWARAFMFGSQPDTIFPLRGPIGSGAAPTYSFYANPRGGLWATSSIVLLTGGQAAAGTDVAGGRCDIRGGQSRGAANGGDVIMFATPPAASSGSSLNTEQRIFEFGASNGAFTLGNYTLVTGASGTTSLVGVDQSGTTNIAGGPVNLDAGRGTGSGSSGSVKIRWAPSGASGTSTNSLVDGEEWLGGSSVDPQLRSTVLYASNGGTMTRQAYSELLTLSTSGTTTDTSANLLPAGAIILAVATRVTTEISGGGVTAFSVGDSTTAARFSASAGGLTANSTRVGLQHQQGSVATDAAGPVQTAAAKVRITTDATPTAGVVRITVWALVFVAPTN